MASRQSEKAASLLRSLRRCRSPALCGGLATSRVGATQASCHTSVSPSPDTIFSSASPSISRPWAIWRSLAAIVGEGIGQRLQLNGIVPEKGHVTQQRQILHSTDTPSVAGVALLQNAPTGFKIVNETKLPMI